MFDIFLPFLIGVAIGIPAPQNTQPQQGVAQADPAAAPDRAPEPQIPTGQFTTAVEVKPILGMTRQNWVAIRRYDGNDLVYFTHLLSWRCGLWDIRYSVNGDAEFRALTMEPCHTGTAQPNAMTDVANFLPYITLPDESVESVHVEITFDDGTTDFAVFERQDVLMP